MARQCKYCHKFKKTGKHKYGKLLAKKAENRTMGWNQCGSNWTVYDWNKSNGKKELPIVRTLTATTSIYLITGWFEIAEKFMARAGNVFLYY